MFTIKSKPTKNGIVKTKDFLSKNKVQRKNGTIVIVGNENSKYEKFKRKSEKLLEILNI